MKSIKVTAFYLKQYLSNVKLKKDFLIVSKKKLFLLYLMRAFSENVIRCYCSEASIKEIWRVISIKVSPFKILRSENHGFIVNPKSDNKKSSAANCN